MIEGFDLRKMRLEAKKTTSEMARLAGVKSRKTYENWEKNVGRPNINQFLNMAQGCGYNISPVLNWAKSPPVEANKHFS